MPLKRRSQVAGRRSQVGDSRRGGWRRTLAIQLISGYYVDVTETTNNSGTRVPGNPAPPSISRLCIFCTPVQFHYIKTSLQTPPFTPVLLSSTLKPFKPFKRFKPSLETLGRMAALHPARVSKECIRTAYFMRTDGRYSVSSGKTKSKATQRNSAMRKG